MMMIIITNLIYLVQFDTNGIVTHCTKSLSTYKGNISRVSGQNGISRQYVIVEIHTILVRNSSSNNNSNDDNNNNNNNNNDNNDGDDNNRSNLFSAIWH